MSDDKIDDVLEKLKVIFLTVLVAFIIFIVIYCEISGGWF